MIVIYVVESLVIASETRYHGTFHLAGVHLVPCLEPTWVILRAGPSNDLRRRSPAIRAPRVMDSKQE